MENVIENHRQNQGKRRPFVYALKFARPLVEARTTLFLVLTIVLAALLGNLWPPLGSTGFLANKYALATSGEVWRPFTSWLVHLDHEHLAMDVAYLLIVGVIFEKRHGARVLLLTFFLATFIASWFCVFLDPHYLSECGSSTGTHALVAFFATWAVAKEGEPALVQLLWLAVLTYLAYLSIAGILTGRMGWPFGFFPNCGVDHLVAVLTAVGLALFLPRRWALVEAAHDRKSRMGGGQDGC